MDNNLNIFEKENLVKDAEVIKKDIKKGKKFRNIIVRGISLAAAISIFMSSIAFAGEHTVDNWEDYKRAIVQDIMKQDTLIKIEYNGKDVFQGNDLNEKVVSLYQDAIKTIKGTVEYKNILKTLPDRKYSKNIEDRTYSLISGEYEMVYKNSTEDMKEVLATVRNTLNEIITKDMSDYEKVRAVYDFVIDSYRYENFAKDHNDTENIIKERNMLLGLKGHGVVCEAYAMLFSTMVTELGYDNIIVSGIVDGTGHAWNLIKINNQWYHVDPTWGDVDIRGIVQDFRESNPDTDENLIWEVAQQFADEKRDLYFLTSDSVMRDERHSWDNSYPSAPEIYNIDAEKDKQEDKELELEKQMKKRIQELESKVEDVDNLADIQNLKNSIYELENEVNCLKNNNLKEELKANLSDLLSVLDNKEIQILEEQKKKELEELEELVGKANEAVILAENTLDVENVNIARELVLDLRNKEVDENIVTSLLNRLDEVEEKIQKEDNNSVEEPKEPSTEQENPDVEEPAIEEPTAEEPKDNQDNDGVGDNQQEPDVETPEEPEEPMDKDETPEDEEPKIDNPSTEEPEEEPAMEKPKANNPETVTKAVYLVEKAEETKLEEDIIVAEGFVQEELNNGEIKEELVNRLTSLKASLGLDNQQDQEDDNKDNSGVEDNPKEPEGKIEEPEEPQKPDVEEPTAEEPDVDDVEEPTVEEPTAEEPMDDNMNKEETPKDKKPTVEEPEEPVTEDPIIEEPITEEPVVEEPTHDDLQDQIEQPQEPTIEEPIAKPKDNDTVIDNKESEMEKPVTTPEEDKDVDTDTTNSDKPVIEEPVTEKPTKDLGEKDNKVEKPVQSKDDSTKNNQSVEDKQNSSNHLNDNDTKSSSIEEEAEEDDDDDEDDEDTSMEENKVENNKEKESKLEKEKQQVQRNKMSKQKIEEVKTILKVVANANAKITVEGKDVKSDVKPYIYKEKEDKILLPIRFVAEALGFDVKWSKATWDKGIRKVFLSKEGKGIVMGIDETSYYVNGKAFKADIAPQLKDGRTYVSMDFLIEVLEIEFDYQNNGGAIEFKIN